MAAIVWQVPRQMFAAVRAAIYIVAKHRHTNICKRTVRPFFVLSQSGQQRKQMGLNIVGIWYLNFVSSKKREKKAWLFWREKKNRQYAQQSQELFVKWLSHLSLIVFRSAKDDFTSPSQLKGFFKTVRLKAKAPKTAAEENFSNIPCSESPL